MNQSHPSGSANQVLTPKSGSAESTDLRGAKPLLSIRNLSRRFDLRNGLQRLYKRKEGSIVHAVDDVSFDIFRGECFGIIGESGCGKSTLGRTLLQLQPSDSGSVHFDGQEITGFNRQTMLPLRRRMQLIFQDPYASLNPRRTVEEIVSQSLVVHNVCAPSARRDMAVAILEKVGLSAESLRRYPHQFSGGQRQRIAIARALIVSPELVVCDEVVSALDVSVQAQVLQLLRQLQKELSLTYVFISHNLAVVGFLCERVAVMYLGEVVETGNTRQLLSQPKHPYTEALLSAVPQLRRADRRERILLTGDLPSPTKPPLGCKFHPRCPKAMDRCKVERPKLRRLDDGRDVACHLYQS